MSLKDVFQYTTVTISVENLVAEEALRPVILSFSIDSQCKKVSSEFFGGDTGGIPLEWLEESEQKKSEIFFKLTDTTDL